jgi:hypothetical protein
MTHNGHLWGAVTTALSLLALWPVIHWARGRKRRFDRCVATDARMTALIDGSEGGKRLRYQFRDKSGRLVTGTSNSASQFITQRVGDHVPVLYDPEEPTWNEIDWWESKYGGPALFFAVLGPWLIAGILMLVSGKTEWHWP